MRSGISTLMRMAQEIQISSRPVNAWWRALQYLVRTLRPTVTNFQGTRLRECCSDRAARPGSQVIARTAPSDNRGDRRELDPE
jgi:hypothetical protein